ncbi:hypothetical protein BD779DRAFT_1489439 [Infundibulicybe gibba]|nr:hypothetical protein BD779DRAFT_1489439 [Infundibulicybe gibba]
MVIVHINAYTVTTNLIMPPSISEPKQLVDEFKKSGEFDRLRRELLTQFERMGLHRLNQG